MNVVSLMILMGSLLTKPGAPHVGLMAEYFYSVNGGQLEMKFMMDVEELKMFDLDPGCDPESALAICASKYIDDHSAIKINNKDVELMFNKSFVENGHMVIFYSSDTQIGEVEHLEVNVDAFVEQNELFKNRVILNIPGVESSYRLNRSRTQILL